MKTIIITGAGGFLGSHLCRHFANQGYRIIGIGQTLPEIDLLERIEIFVTATLPDPSIESLITNEKPIALIHAAGGSVVSASVNEPYEDFTKSVPATAFLLETLRKHSSETKFIYLSSAAVYGNPEAIPVKESAIVKPLSPYGYHKFLNELLCEEYAVLYNLKTIAVRIFSAYGEGQKKQVLWDICMKLQASSDIKLYGTGEETRDFINVEDVSQAVRLLVEAENEGYSVYNLASGSETSIKTIASMIKRLLKPDAKVMFSGETMPGYPVRWQADISKLRAIGFRPSYNIKYGIDKYVEWYSMKQK